MAESVLQSMRLTPRAGPPPSGGGGGGGPGGAAGGHGGGGGPSTAEVDNELFANYILITLVGIAAALVIYRLILGATRHLRTVVCLNNANQAYFAQPTPWVAGVKRHLLGAPLLHVRHHRDILLARGWSLGIVPTRLQSVALAGMVAMNIALSVQGIEWRDGNANTLSHFRNRTGTLAVANMIPLVIMAGRNNPLIALTGLSYDTFNLLHRWFGRICVAEALAHMVAHMCKAAQFGGGLQTFPASLKASQLILTGFIAFLAFMAIYLTAWTAFRRAFYEVFCHLHAALALTSMIALWYHLDGLDPQIYLKIAIAAWAIERGIRLLTIAYRNLGGRGHGSTRAVVEVLPGDALRVTLHLARPWTFSPGQHAFLTIPSVGLWTAHPFSLAWSDDISDDPLSPALSTASDPEKALPPPLSNSSSALARPTRTTVSAIVRRRDGFTAALHRKAAAAGTADEFSPLGRFTTRALVEGPYGAAGAARAALPSYGTVLLLAGGVGITHQLPHVRALVAAHASGAAATRRLTLAWIVQSVEHLEWVRPWMTQVLALPGRRDVLRVLLFVTRPRSAREVHSPSATVRMFPGRPNVESLVRREVEEGIGAVCVSVCGPGALADDARRAVRRCKGRVVDFVEESFSW